MILRIFYLLGLLFSCSSQVCKTRVDVLSGDELSSTLAIFLKEKIITKNAAECSLECYKTNCDVAYFHQQSSVCQFAKDSSTEDSLVLAKKCALPYAKEELRGTKMDTVRRFCVYCGSLSDLVAPPTTTTTARPKKPSRRIFLTNETPFARNPFETIQFEEEHRISIPARPITPVFYQRLRQKANLTNSFRARHNMTNVPHIRYKRPVGVSKRRKSSKLHKKKYSNRFFHKETGHARVVSGSKYKRRGNGIARKRRQL